MELELREVTKNINCLFTKKAKNNWIFCTMRGI